MRRLAFLVCIVFAGNVGRAGDACCVTPERLLRMNECELLDLYRAGTVTAAPCGFADGWAIYKPGRASTVPRAHFTRALWKGKEFSADGTTMINHIGKLRMIKADVFPGDSWLDGKPTLVFDYLCTSRLFSNVRDEVREVAPGVYLGLTYLRKKCGAELAVFFVLDARPCR
jgi:hypothetical protein